MPALYTFIMFVWIVFGENAGDAGDYVNAFRLWVFLTFLTMVLYGTGCMIGTAAKFSAKPHRVFIAGITAISPILIPLLMGAMSGEGEGRFHPVGLDIELALYTAGTIPVFGLMFIKMYTAIRRVREVTAEG